MANNVLQQQKIHRNAWRIYKLVQAKQAVQAEHALNALGDEMTAVAHVLVLGEFRATPFVKFEWYIIGTGFVIAPMALTLGLYSILGRPAYWHDTADVMIFYFCVFGAAFLVESMIAAAGTELRDRRVRKRGSAHPIHITNEIASCALAARPGNDPGLIAALLEAGEVEPEPSAGTRRKLDEALIRLLPYCLQETLQQLNASQRRALWRRLGRVVGVVRPSTITGPEKRRLTNDSEYHEAMVGIAILKAYERLPDEQAIGTVRSLANKSPQGLGAGWDELIEATKHCLPILEDLVMRSRSGSELLRGSSDAATDGNDLLRSAHGGTETDGRELLRAR